MALRYEYSTADSYYVLLTFLVLTVVPATYYVASRPPAHEQPAARRAAKDATDLPKCPCKTCARSRAARAEAAAPNFLARAVAPADPAAASSVRKAVNTWLGTFSVANFAIGALWSALLLVVYKIATGRTVVQLWDPYAVLGVAEGASKKAIRAAYRALSLAEHPDKVAAGLRKAAEAKFTEISKAYKVLTDAKAMANFEKYGSPDGPQATSFGIALPPWMTNATFVVVAYLALLAAIGYGLYRVFYLGGLAGSPASDSQKLENGLMRGPLEKLALSFKGPTAGAKDPKDSPPVTVDRAFAMIASTARAHHPDYAVPAETARAVPKSASFGEKSTTPASTALHAHLHRAGPVDPEFVSTCDKVSEAMVALALQRGRLADALACVAAQRAIISAAKPTDAPLLALPHLTPAMVAKLGGSAVSILSLVRRGRDALAKTLAKDLSEEEIDEVWTAAGDAPYLAITGASFGDVTSGATPGNETTAHADSGVIACTAKMIVTTVRDQAAREAAGTAPSTTTTAAAAATASPKLTGAAKRKAAKEGKKSPTPAAAAEVADDDRAASATPPAVLTREIPPAYVHAPYFPEIKRSGIWLFLSEQSGGAARAPILNGALIPFDDPRLLTARDDETGEVTFRIAMRGPRMAATFNLCLSAVTTSTHWAGHDTSRTFRVKLDRWSKKQRMAAGADAAEAEAAAAPAKYQVIDIEAPRGVREEAQAEAEAEAENAAEEAS
ncbi:secretory subunit [Blastocladiella emersonii ATCC 22665]|nr:secretory subunit [Blastocladiella emersonii ATCC 22665]